MSDYYYLVCDFHKERICVSSPNIEFAVSKFAWKHCGCLLRSIADWDDDAHDDEFKQWTSENLNEMIDMDRLEPDNLNHIPTNEIKPLIDKLKLGFVFYGANSIIEINRIMKECHETLTALTQERDALLRQSGKNQAVD